MKKKLSFCPKIAAGLAGIVLAMGTTSCGNSGEELDSTGSRPLDTLGPFLSPNEVRTHIRNAGFPNSLVETLVRIAECESSFGTNSFAWGGGNRHTGIFQISDLHKSSCGYGGSSLDTFRARMTDPAKNAACAYVVYREAGNSLTPWDCY
jgi:hypothetical protein